MSEVLNDLLCMIRRDYTVLTTVDASTLGFLESNVLCPNIHLPHVYVLW
jgi:hypothetical protein